MNVLKAVRDKILTSTAITSQLAKFKFGTTPEPAVFTMQLFPTTTEYPAIILRQAASIWGGYRDSHAGTAIIDIGLYANKGYSDAKILDTALKTSILLDRADLDISGYTSAVVLADPPRQTFDKEGFIGYVVSLLVYCIKQ